MTSVKLGTCIHIVGKLSPEGDSGGRVYEQKTEGKTTMGPFFDREFRVIPKTHSFIQSMTP
jgi:hypothetical protein